jgi:ABC-type lipoprotein export system ATPase subunit
MSGGGGLEGVGAAELRGLAIGALLDRYPFVSSFFADEGLDFADEIGWTLARCLEHHRASHPALDDRFEEGLLERLERYVEEMLEFVSEEEEPIESVTLLGGTDKTGAPEPVRELTIRVGEVIAIVGPTGSGKSRLLGDLEWVAQGDTPTRRRVLLNGKTPDRKWRFSTEHKLVAQLSQNMNFVMDLGVRDFLRLHAESRRVKDPEERIARIWDSANALAGEPFGIDAPVTSLSGGQSRALMIADTAVLSRSPVVLIDEIENAGIDRRRALELLIREEKIVLMATHDPILALSGQRRIVLRGGAMQAVITPTPRELENVEELRAIDARMMELRNRLRRGEVLETI